MSRIKTLTLKSQKDIAWLSTYGSINHYPLSLNFHGLRAVAMCFYDIRHPADEIAIGRISLITRREVIILRPLIKTLGGRDE